MITRVLLIFALLQPALVQADSMKKLLEKFSLTSETRKLEAIETKKTEVVDLGVEVEIPKSLRDKEKEDVPYIFNEFNQEMLNLGPDEDLPQRVQRDALPSIINILKNKDNPEVAQKYAAQYVRYMIDMSFNIRLITQHIMEAYAAEGRVEEEVLMGGQQRFNLMFARAQEETGSSFQPRHRDALRQIDEPDPKGEAEIYWFFSLNCVYCGEPTRDLERLWRIVAREDGVKMGGAVIGTPEKEWLDSWKSHYGVSFPVYDGTEFAEKLRIRRLPALVIVSPNNKRSYIRTGVQSFRHMYEFLRTVQGKPITYTRKHKRLETMPVRANESVQQVTELHQNF